MRLSRWREQLGCSGRARSSRREDCRSMTMPRPAVMLPKNHRTADEQRILTCQAGRKARS